MQVISIAAIPAQTFDVTLGGQACRITLRQKAPGMFLDLECNGVVLLRGALCRNATRLVRHQYKGFVGDLMVMDTQGASDPEYSGLNDRWLLCYLEAGE